MSAYKLRKKIRAMEEVSRQRAQKVMIALVACLKTQQAVAFALGVSKQRFNNWYCGWVKKVPFEVVLAMEALWEEKQRSAPPEDFFAKACLYQALARHRDALRLMQQQSQVPLYPLYFELGDTCCDARGWFRWDRVVLEEKLTLSHCMNVCQGLEALCQCGAVEKIQQEGAWYGRILYNE